MCWIVTFRKKKFIKKYREKMSRSPRKPMAAEDEMECLASQESTSSNDERPKSQSRSISPPDEKMDSTQSEVLSTATDSGSVVSSATETREDEEESSDSPSEMEVNLLEKTIIWKNRQLKEQQCDFLKYHYVKMVGYPVEINWYKRYDEVSSKKPKRIQDLPCECHLEEKCDVLENSEQSCEEKEKPTERESIDENRNDLKQSPIHKLAKHNITCNVRRTCLYFSSIAEYFIDEEVDPDIFLYTPLPKEKYGEDSVDYEYYILQENRKILILKLWEGLRTKLESWEEGMAKVDKFQYEFRNELRIAKHLVLNNLLEDLVKPYENLTCREERNSLKQNPSKQTPDQIDEDEGRYLKLKYEYLELKETLLKEASLRGNQRFIDDALHYDYSVSYEEFLDNGKNIEGNNPSTSKDKNEQEIEKMKVDGQATVTLGSKRKQEDSEQETEGPEGKRKKGD